MARNSGPILVDRYGRPMSIAFHEAGDVAVRRERPLFYYNSTQDWDTLLPTGSWKQILSSSRFLFANVPMIRGALMEQARYSFPLQAHYVGSDQDYGRLAEEFLFFWKKSNNVKGGPYDQHANSRIRMLSRKIDGDIATIFVRRPQDVFPKVQYVRAHRIGDRGPERPGARANGIGRIGNDGLLADGPYKGRKIRNGVISDDWGAALAYRILGDKPEQDMDLPADQVFLTFNPEVSDQTRGLGELVASIGSVADLKRLREYEMRAQQICASLTVIEKNATGTADEASEAITRDTSGNSAAGTPSGLVVETFGAGTVRYIKSGDGSGLEAFRGDRPSSDARAWEDKIVTAALYGIGWDANFALAIKEPGGAWARTVLAKINQAINENVRIEAKDQAREDYWALSVAMEEGLLPRPKDGDAHSWEYVLENDRLSADSGNEKNAEREAYKLGTTTLRAVYSGQGKWWVDQRAQKQVETTDLLRRAQAIRTEFPELSLVEILTLLEQRSPNPVAPPPSEPDTDDPKNGKDAKE